MEMAITANGILVWLAWGFFMGLGWSFAQWPFRRWAY